MLANGFTIPYFIGLKLGIIGEIFVYVFFPGVSVMGVILLLLGIYGWSYLSIPIVFNKLNGYFYKGNKCPRKVFLDNKYTKGGLLHDIYALQIIVGGEKKSKDKTPEFELNLVMKDATRVHLIEHGAPNSMRSDAQKLSDFLGVPVWDATKENGNQLL
jgi:hypothetical protein